MWARYAIQDGRATTIPGDDAMVGLATEKIGWSVPTQ